MVTTTEQCDHPRDTADITVETERLTGVLRDRLTHHVNILGMNDESYRPAQSRAGKAKPKS